MKISIIIVTWNKKELLKDCLSSLKNQTYRNFQTIIVDNYSTDGTLEFIKRYHPKMKLISLNKNFGFSGAVNIGIKSSNSDYIILLNNDTVVDKNFVKYLFLSLRRKRNENYCACTAKIIDFFKRKSLAAAGDFMNDVGQSFPRGFGENINKFNKTEGVFLITGCASIFLRDIFEKIGYFDEDYFFSGEDADWCLRAQISGYKFLYEPKAIVFHYQKASSREMFKKMNYFHFRNMTLTILKNFPLRLFLKKWRFITIPFTHLTTIMYLLSKGCLKEAVNADFWIIKNLGKIIKKRRQIQRKLKVDINYLNTCLQPKKIRFFNLSK